MPINLFSTYSTGENRVTASILAVLRSLSLDRMQRLLGALLEELEFELVTFQNQPGKGGEGVPDAIIQSSCRLLIETKVRRKAVKADQLKRHLERLDKATETTQLLLVLTPDDVRPTVFDSIQDARLAWASFAALDQAIDGMLSDKYEVVSEREAFLLRELQNMLMAEGLITNENDVVVIPARNAWPEYQQYHAYVCQPDRSFQQVKRLAFYTDGQIFPLVPKILEFYDHVEFVVGKNEGQLGELVCTLLKAHKRNEGTVSKVVFLSPPESPDTLKLDKPILNDCKSKAGKPIAFVQNQRYVSSKSLKIAKTTSDLVDS